MYRNNKLAKSVRLALMLGAGATAFTGAAVAQEQNEEEAADRTERIQVTGSRIQRTDMEGALPVTVIDRAAIDMSGENSITDVIRNTTFNTAGSFRPVSGNAAGATASVSMRGLGADRTLILVDGRRLPTSPLTGSSQDLNIIPLGMVERIEVLSDGASAMYGSDAIGGVINIITRSDFNGAELRYGVTSASLPSDGGDREEGSVVFGSSSDTTRIIGGVSWNNRDIIFNRAYDWNDPEPWTGYGNNWNEVGDGQAASQAFLEACGGERMPYYFLTENPNTDGVTGCSYQHTAVSASEAQTGNQAIYIKADHDLNNDWTIFFNASLSRSKYFGRYAPTLNDPGDTLRADSINNPTNPNSPIYQEVQGDGSPIGEQREVDYYHRTAAIGNRDTTSDNYTRDFHLGATGRIGEVDLDFGARRTSSRVYDTGRGYLLRSALLAAANITDEEVAAGEAANPDFAYYRLDDPFGMRYQDNEVAYAAHQALVNGMNVTTSRFANFQVDEIYASAAFDLFDLNAGTVQAVVGAEYREEDYVDQYDALSEAGVVGGSSGSSAGGGREVSAAYFETLIPITYDFEVTLAGRFDDYSDYGSDFSPKLGFRWQPIQELVLRGSWGQGFRAPSLDILTMQPSSGNPGVNDWVLCAAQGTPDEDCRQQQVRQETIANPELASEQSEQFSLGIAYQPLDWLNLTVDYYNIEITDSIRLFGAQTLIDRELVGDPIPDGLGVNRNANGVITTVDGGYANDGELNTDGLDINIVATFDYGQFGSSRHNLQWSHVFELTEAGVDRNLVKDRGVPQDRITLTNNYMYGDFDFGWNVNLIGSTYSAQSGAGDDVTRSGHIGTWVTHDLQVSYNTAWDGRITVGARNMFEKVPALVPHGGRDYNMSLYDAYGRLAYIRYTQRF